MKTVFLGFCDDSNRTQRYQEVRGMFRRAGFSVSEQRDFRSWLWFHFILDAGLLSQAIKSGGYSRMIQSREDIKESVLLMREMVPLLKAKGGTPRLGATPVSRAPAYLLSHLMQRFLRAEHMYSFIMDQVEITGHGSLESMAAYPRDVLADARRIGVPLPRLAALESLFREAAR